MRIDRPDEDDAPGVEHDSPAAERDSPAAERDTPAAVEPDAGIDSDADRVACNVRYRATVDAAVYQAAREAWAEALPALRQAWEAHKEKYPERTVASAQDRPDGSWRGDGDRELNPAQNAEVDRGCEEIRGVGGSIIIPGVRGVEAEDSSRHLVGFEHRFKGTDRLKEKIADQLRSTPGLTSGQALATIPDAMRFTFQYADENSYMAGVKKDIERLEAHGFIQVERRNTWTSEQYKGINSRWREPESGLIFEVQFHTRVSFEAKELTHKAYERIRGTAEDPELAEVKEFQRRVCAMIPLPPGVTEYDDYPPEERDG